VSAPPTAAPERIKRANTRYHDAAADDYDSKWGIDFGALGQRQVLAKLEKALGEAPRRVGDALEIGAGTGYFTLNLLQLGLIDRATATDISSGMLARLEATAARLGLAVQTTRTEAERLPFADSSFDLVYGHAVLHHVPDPPRALREFRRVLRPGGLLAFCGEPSHHGDRIAALPKLTGRIVAPLWRRALRARPRRPAAGACLGHELEWEVDVHAFRPTELRAMVEAAGFAAVRLRGEELLANAHGWLLRTLEASAEPTEVPFAWRLIAFRSYLALQRVDSALLEPHLPPELFYNLVLSARRPPELRAGRGTDSPAPNRT
jgi:ubiquinone/menaquinone biosynthesis C-methylase UbiE